MKKYIKKQIKIEAVQWTGDNTWEVAKFLATGSRDFKVDSAKETVEIETLEGIMTASKYDYIIKGIKGEFYPCKPDIFEATYEEVEDEQN